MYAPGDFQQQQQQQQQQAAYTSGYTSGCTSDVQTQHQTVIYPSIVDEKQMVQSFDQTVVSNGQFNTRQPANLQYTGHAAPASSPLYPPEKTAYADPQLTSAFNYPPPNPYINPQSSTAYPPEKVHFELYPQSQPSSAFPPQGTPYTQPLPPGVYPPGVYPPEKTGYSLISQPSLPPAYPPSISEKGIYDPVPQPLVPPPPYSSPAPSVGPETALYAQQHVQQGYQTQNYVPPPDPLVYTPPPPKPKDEKKSGTAKRFLGDTLVGRFARSAVHTTTSTVRLVTYLSPWGDNNSVTLPNVRYRDAALFATFSVIGGPLLEGTGDLLGGAVGDTFASTVIDPMTDFFVNNTVAKYALFQIIEQAIDKGILEHMFPEQEKMLRTTSMRTLQCAVKHKLMDVEANIQLFYPTDSVNSASIEKGWFCPYFYSSNRTPKIARQLDFGIAQCFGPFLRGDHQLAEKLLSESNTALSLCDPDPAHDTHTRRLLVTFLGITPYRAGMWSTSRRPGVSLVNYHLLNGCPALVIPVSESCPITAWSPVTMKSITSLGFDPAPLHGMICEFLDSVIRMEGILPKLRERYDEVLSRCVSLVINGAVGLRDAEVPKEMMKKLDPERAGIAFFRY